MTTSTPGPPRCISLITRRRLHWSAPPVRPYGTMSIAGADDGVHGPAPAVRARLLPVRVVGVERLDELIVVAARLAVAQELHTLDLDLLRVGLGLQERDDLRHELVERHRELAVLLAGQQRGADGRRLEFHDLHARVGELQPDRLTE